MDEERDKVWVSVIFVMLVPKGDGRVLLTGGNSCYLQAGNLFWKGKGL